MTGVVPYPELDTAEPVAYVLRYLGHNFGSALVGTGALCGLSTVILVFIYAQTRAFFAMSRDGLLPNVFSQVHPKYGTPVKITILVGVCVAALASFTPIHVIAEMTSAGTLFAFLCSLVGVVLLRRRHPELNRPFKCPALYFMATIGFIFSAYIFLNLSAHTFELFGFWLTIGLIIYASYGYKHSRLNASEKKN